MKRFSLLIAVIIWFAFAGVVHAQDETAAVDTTTYLEMTPSFVLNYGEGNRLRYIRTDITLRLSTEGSIIGDVNIHMPLLRHVVIMFLSRQSDQRIRDAGQRDALRLELLEEMRDGLSEVANSSGIKDLLFTTFIVQQ